MTKKGLFFISDYRNVTCKPGRDPSYWMLKELDKNGKFKVYSTANKVIDSSCFEKAFDKFVHLNTNISRMRIITISYMLAVL